MFPVNKPLPRPPSTPPSPSRPLDSPSRAPNIAPNIPSRPPAPQRHNTLPEIPKQTITTNTPSKLPNIPPSIPARSSPLPEIPKRDKQNLTKSQPNWNTRGLGRSRGKGTRFNIGTARLGTPPAVNRASRNVSSQSDLFAGNLPGNSSQLQIMPNTSENNIESDDSDDDFCPPAYNESCADESATEFINSSLAQKPFGMPAIAPPSPNNYQSTPNEEPKRFQEPATDTPTPSECEIQENNKTDDNLAPVFRGQWNPSVAAPKPVSFVPTVAPTIPINENRKKLPTTPIQDSQNLNNTNINRKLPPAPTPDNNEDEFASLRQKYNSFAPAPPAPPSESDSDEPPPEYGIEEEEEEEEEPPPYGFDDEFDDDEIIAFLESEIEKAEEEEGVDTLEECKMMIKWGEAGEAPPVPSRDDPSHQLSEINAKRFIQQKEEVPDAYSIIRDDPRYQRLRLKWAPDVFTGTGAVQFAKNKIDPATLPYVGILFHMNRVKDAVKGHARVEKISASASPELKKSMDTFKGACKTRGIQESAYTGVAACCMMLPVVDFIPGLSAQLMILGEVGAGVAESGIEMGLKVLISKGSGQLTASAMERTDAFGGFGSSKAFLLYIGLPKTDDPLYAEWEPYRLKLKTLYGSAPEDDLMKMKPKGSLLRQIQKEERKSGKPYQIEVPLLVLLYRAFDCWHELYWDRAVKLKEFTKGKTRNVLGLRRELTLDERRRMRDYRKLQETASVIESQSAIDPHLQILRKQRKKEIVELLTTSLLHSYHVAYLFTRKKLRSEQQKNLKWFMKMVVDYFFAHNAFFWGYVGTDNELKAVAIWDRPHESARISFLSMLRTDGTLKLGPAKWKKMSDILFKMEEIRKNEIRGLRCWMLHWIAVHPRYQKQGIGELLVKNTLTRHNEPIYVQLYDTETEMITFLKKLCFVPVCHEYSKFQLYGQRVSVVAYWYGMQSPSELRALLPAKKKNPLQLTYSTIRKASDSLQALPNRAATQQLRLANEQYLQESAETKLLKEAQQRYEETAMLLDHLKIDLASLPTENRDNDPLAQSLQSKIAEYQHLVDIYRSSLDDAKRNVDALKRGTTQLRIGN